MTNEMVPFKHCCLIASFIIENRDADEFRLYLQVNRCNTSIVIYVLTSIENIHE